MTSLNKKLIEKLYSLPRGYEAELRGFIDEFCEQSVVDDTKIQTHFYKIKSDPHNRPKIKAFTEQIASFALDYAIPRKQVYAANPSLHNGSNSHVIRLHKEARSLFTDLVKSGEGGEILLFALAEKILKLPQLVCKMSLKTDSKAHFHGADGVHVGTNEQGRLTLYWGESKVHKTASEAIADCFNSLKDFVHADSLFSGDASNDFLLIFKSPNLPPQEEKLEEAILSYFDMSSENIFEFETRAIALIGFDEKAYNNEEKDVSSINDELKKRISSWKKSLKTQSKNYNLNAFFMHVFLLPFPSVEDFRKNMLEALDINQLAE